MSDVDAMMAVIYEAIDDLNPSLELKLDKTPDTVLFGHGTRLDSVGLVNLIVSIEQGIEDRFGAALTLADERAMSQKQSPFRTVRTLAEYAAARVAEGHG